MDSMIYFKVDLYRPTGIPDPVPKWPPYSYLSQCLHQPNYVFFLQLKKPTSVSEMAKLVSPFEGTVKGYPKYIREHEHCPSLVVTGELTNPLNTAPVPRRRKSLPANFDPNPDIITVLWDDPDDVFCLPAYSLPQLLFIANTY